MFALLLFLLSLLAKPTWIMLPVLLLLLDYRVANEPPRGGRIAWLDKLPFFLVAGAVLAIHLASSGYAASGPTSVSLAEVAWLQRLANSVVIYAIYLVSGLVPLWSSLYLPYPVDPFPLYCYLGSLLLLAALSLGAWLGRRRWPDLFFGWGWFLVALVPVLGLLGAGEAVLVGDRWSYLPHIGLLFGLVSLAAGRLAKVDGRLQSALLAALVLGFAVAAWSTTRAWADDEAYWVRTLAQTEGNHFAHFQLSDVYARQGDGAARERHLRAALAVKSDDPKYLLNLAIHLQNEGRDAEAAPYLERMLAIDTVPIPYDLALGQLMMYRGQLDMALRFLVRAASREPGTPAARQARDTALFTVALLHAVLGRPDAARALFDRLLELDAGAQPVACDRYRAEFERMPAVFDLARPRAALEEACAGTDVPK
jgi:tetratricopeptide (TPR) repeat protein